MKTIKYLFSFFILFFLSQFGYSLGPSVLIFVNHSISCNSGNDGELSASSAGGTSPYTYLWSNNATTQSISSLTAGTYTVIATDANGATATYSIDLGEPHSLGVTLIQRNISCNGGANGNISTEVSGGTPPYTYSWTPSGTGSGLRDIPAGNYSVVVTDNNGCSTGASVTLTEPPPIQLTINVNNSHNNYAISCWKGSDGAISMTVSGGTGPYTYLWTNGGNFASVVEDPINLKAGNYQVVVTDANGCTKPSTTPIILAEPSKINILLTPYVWPNGYNVSCFGCFNGSITSNVTGGIAPYTYLWTPSLQTTPNATNLDARATILNVLDANQCPMSEVFDLRGPSDSWKITGNVGTNGGANFLGTSDPTDFVIKTGAQERMRITVDGKVGIGFITPTKDLDVSGSIRLRTYSSSAGGFSLLKTDVSGNLSKVTESTNPSSEVLFGDGSWGAFPAGAGAWIVNGNDIYRDNGNVGIGTAVPSVKLEVQGDVKVSGDLILAGTSSKITTNDLHVKQTVEVGNSIWLGGANQGGNNQIFTDDFDLEINCNPAYNLNTILNTNQGKVGIGVIDPLGKFEVHDNGNNTLEILSDNAAPTKRGISLGKDEGGNGNKDGSFNFWIHEWQNSNNSCAFNFKETHNNTTLMRIQKDGKVIIGTGLPLNANTNYDYGLYVGAGIITEKVKVAISTTNDWNDKVFADDYDLMSLQQLENYVVQNKHLPEIPSATEVVENGIDLGSMDAKLLLKIEELTLYIIDQQKQIDEMRMEIKNTKR